MSFYEATARYFLGSNTKKGFLGTTESLYQTQGWRVYILKSGAGTGKSTFLRRVCNEKMADGVGCEVFCCSSDPDSLDAVRIPEKRLLFVDGTAPHILEPAYWGAVEQIVPLSLCMGDGLREHADAIVKLTDRKRTLHRRSVDFIRAASDVLFENRRLQTHDLNNDKIRRLAHRLAVSEWRSGKEAGTPRTSETRFLSAFTPQGWLTLYDTLQALCPRIYAIEDEHGAAAAALLTELQTAAEADGIRCVACPCPLFPDDGPEHLLMPDIGLAFTVSNSFHKVDFPVFRRIHASRFTTSDDLQRHRGLLAFRHRSAVELLKEATALSVEAKTVHDELERFSCDAMDWQRYTLLTDEVLANI